MELPSADLKLASFPKSLAATHRGFTFYIAEPISSIHGLRQNDPVATSLCEARAFKRHRSPIAGRAR